MSNLLTQLAKDECPQNVFKDINLWFKDGPGKSIYAQDIFSFW